MGAQGLLGALRQYLQDAAPGGLLNPEWTPERTRAALGLLADAAPVVGGAKGALEELRAGNPGMAALNAATVPLDLATLGGGAAAKLTAGAALAIDPASKARLVRDLIAGTGSGTYRLGDVTEGQARGLERLLGQSISGRDVMMTEGAFRHIFRERLQKQGYTPKEIADFADQAMRPRARPWADPSKTNQRPALVNQGVRDSLTAQTYDATMPFYLTDDGLLGVASVVPDGLRKRQGPVR